MTNPDIDHPSKTMVILRLAGEITTKSRGIRQQFTRRLVQNLRDALERADIDAEIHERWYRIDVETNDQRACEVASRVFGIQSARWTRAYEWDDLEDIVEIGERLYADRVVGKTFAVRARRAGQRDNIPFTSPEVDRLLGGRLDEAGGEVDLEDYEVRVGLEVREDAVFFYDEERPGVAGLPCGVEGRALALVSGGFDSAVAAWSMMRRGVDMDFLFFNLAGPPQVRATRQVTRRLCDDWAYGYKPKLHVVDFRPMIAEMKARVDGHYWQLLLKRLMVRAGQQIAEDEYYPAMVTGESCGQVSSQTLMNLAAITAPITTAVVRPLVGMNKDEIIERSRRIGTHDLSSEVPEFCALDGGPPTVDARPEELDEREQLVDLELLDELVERRTTTAVPELEIDGGIDVQIDEIPEEAVVIDLRPERDYDDWAFGDAINLPMHRAIEQIGLLPREGSYVLYCEVGLKSAFLAEQMQQEGYEAYSFSGGVPKLKKYGERGGAER